MLFRSSFPSASSFILNVLYGHDDFSFTLEDLLKNYSYNQDFPGYGSIVIGNDSKKAGIALDENYFIVPDEYCNILLIDESSLNSHFPNGYTLKWSKSRSAFRTLNSIQASINNTNVCSLNCYGSLFYSLNDPMFDQNIFWNINMASEDNLTSLWLNGYMETYNQANKSGKVKLILGSFRYKEKDDDFEIIDDKEAYLKFDTISSTMNISINFKVPIYQNLADIAIQGKVNINFNPQIE